MIKTLYIAKFTHCTTQRHFFKVGITNYDFKQRFEISYPEREGYKDFQIECLFEKKTEMSERLESKIQKIFPKNFLLEKYLGLPYDYYKNRFTGITECFITEDENIHKLVETLMCI